MYKGSVIEVRDNQGDVAYKYLVSDVTARKVIWQGPNRSSHKAAMRDSIAFMYGAKSTKETKHALG
jgi:hypothetical protein